jgi:hypothetical protein
MNTTSTIVAIALSIILFAVPRRLFLLPFIVTACFIPMGQKFILFGLEFTVLRILLLAGIIRILVRNENRNIIWNNFDKLIFAWAFAGGLIYIVNHSSTSAIINRLGFIYDSVGMYWLFRQAISKWEDAFQVIKNFALLAIISAPLIALEKFQGYSFFTLFGNAGGEFHRGRFRAAGPFPHFIIMGSFWASLLPLFYARIKAEKNTLFFGLAITGSFICVYFSASSTPLLAMVAIIVFWSIHKYRIHGKTIFWVCCSGLFLLHLVMNAPVWHLLARIGIFAGSTGWHRYFLFNNFINKINEWFLLGTKSTVHWGHVQGDITNQFVLEGVRGGILTLIIFIAIVYLAIQIPGRFSLQEKNSEIKWLSWGICVSMFGHFITFWGISYFGQIKMLLYLIFALVGFTLECSIRTSNKDRHPAQFRQIGRHTLNLNHRWRKVRRSAHSLKL